MPVAFNQKIHKCSIPVDTQLHFSLSLFLAKGSCKYYLVESGSLVCFTYKYIAPIIDNIIENKY